LNPINLILDSQTHKRGIDGLSDEALELMRKHA
jgi:hypothetical protein